ncbi:hypothetical protein EIP91_007567 [Steccherinum ochraceum]|uniref:Urea active transporter n=1 Tax=Steccherinum ochraceum TaxID=92696 RepID=A0A4R0RLL2_9APHY|nr:hypothetical protein EIP91_007567 [Steccherinum ochraceum]
MSDEAVFKPVLEQSVGYGVVVGVGFFFAALMMVLTTLQAKFSRFSPSSSEEFALDGLSKRQTRTGMLRNVRRVRLSVLVRVLIPPPQSQCMDMERDAPAIEYSGVHIRWYGVGGTIQLAFFAIIAAKVKMNANGAHTFLEVSFDPSHTTQYNALISVKQIVKARFGTGAHLLFTFYGFLCILIVCGSLLLGGAATVNALTGMDIIAACFLLPVGIAVYVIFGGLRATFICDWAHTIILFIVIYLFLGRTYGTSPETGSIGRLYDLLVQASIDSPVVGNENGSYVTMKSNQGLVFGFSGVFCDQGYWQRAIASAPRSTTKAYMLGGLSWFAVPWAFASCLGLAARALLNDSKFPTFPHPLSPSQTSAGLAAPAAAIVLMGRGGAVAVLLVVFMAVTSAASAELIAVSSLFSYDLYRTYFRPNATGAEIVRVSHYFICFWAVWMGAWATILHKASIDLGWLFYVQGVVLSPAVVPIGLTVTWSKLTRAGVFSGCIVGAVLGMIAWMIGCLKIYGEINITNLALPYSAVCSGLTGLFFSGVITVAVSLARPADYDFKETRAIAVYEEEDSVSSVSGDLEAPTPNEDEKNKAEKVAVHEVEAEEDGEDTVDRETLQKIFKKATVYSVILTLIVALIVPLPMFFSHYIFSKAFYTFWVACSMMTPNVRMHTTLKLLQGNLVQSVWYASQYA